MKELFLIYLISQALSTAYGLAVIESIKPIVKDSLRTSGYVEKNKNSLYKFNDKFQAILKGFIPFYYCIKAVSLVNGKNPIEREKQRQINSGEYISIEDKIKMEQEEAAEREMASKSIAVDNRIYFEKPEPYKARKNDVSMYDTYETPVEYIERVAESEDNLSITPYTGDDKVVEHVIVKDEVSNSDIAKAIVNLDGDELEALGSKIIYLRELKRKNNLTLEKDVA